MAPKEEPKTDGTIDINVEAYTRTRDHVVQSLGNLQVAIAELTRAYFNHTQTVLNLDPATIDLSALPNITNPLYDLGLLGGARASSPGAKSDVGGSEKKKRKRAPPDPNAPKRALTPFFLYMQHNRPRIAEELGSDAKPKDVSDEGTRRWAEMPEAQKEVWKKLYADNLAVYKEKMKAYKAGVPFSADDDNARAASQLQQDVEGIEASGAEESEEEAEDHEEAPEEGEEEEEEESSPEPVREPTPPRSGKRRRSEAPKKDVSSPVVEKKASPEKKKRTSARKVKEAEEEAPASARKTPAADKRTKKKRKSEAGADE